MTNGSVQSPLGEEVIEQPPQPYYETLFQVTHLGILVMFFSFVLFACFSR